VITTALWVPLRPPHDPAFYISTLLCCSSPYIFISPRSRVGISQLCDTSPLPSPLAGLFLVRYLTPTRILHVRSNLFCICSPTIPHAPFPFIRPWFFLFLTSSAMITFAYCVPFYVYALLSSTLWNAIACSSLLSYLWCCERYSNSRDDTVSRCGK